MRASGRCAILKETKKTTHGGFFMDPKRLFDFLAASPSCYHAVQALSDRLTQEGYTQLHEADAWTLTAGGKYFVTRNGSSLLAFRVPAGAPAYRYSV